MESDDLLSIGHVVAELRRAYPQVSHSSVRFLEREGLITPHRTTGGHRLFTSEDLSRIRQIKDWQAHHLSLAEIRERLRVALDLHDLPAVARAYVDAVVAGDLTAASRLIVQLDDAGMSLVRIFNDVLMPALVEVGQRWERGEITVGQEKEISELTREVVAELTRRHADPDPRGPVVVAAGVAGERHDLGLRMVTGLLRERGWRCHFLGADVAAGFLAESVTLRNPAVVLLSASVADRLPAVQEAMAALRALRRPELRVVVGGRGSTEYAADVRSFGAIPTPSNDFDAVLKTLDCVEQDRGERG